MSGNVRTSPASSHFAFYSLFPTTYSLSLRYPHSNAALPPTLPHHPDSRAHRHPSPHPSRLLLRPRLRLPPPKLVRSRPPVHPRKPPPNLGLHPRMERRRTPLHLLPTHLLGPRSHPRPHPPLDMDPHRVHMASPHRRRLRPLLSRQNLCHSQRRTASRDLLRSKPLHPLHRLRAHRLRRAPRRRLDPPPPPRHPPQQDHHPPPRHPPRSPLANQRPRRRHGQLHPSPARVHPPLPNQRSIQPHSENHRRNSTRSGPGRLL